jgi:hypothetical protein
MKILHGNIAATTSYTCPKAQRAQNIAAKKTSSKKSYLMIILHFHIT